MVRSSSEHDDVIRWKHFPHYWPFVRGTTGHWWISLTQRPVMRSFAVFFDLCSNKRLSKQSRRRCFETPSCPLWRHCNEEYVMQASYNIQFNSVLHNWIFKKIHFLASLSRERALYQIGFWKLSTNNKGSLVILHPTTLFFFANTGIFSCSRHAFIDWRAIHKLTKHLVPPLFENMVIKTSDVHNYSTIQSKLTYCMFSTVIQRTEAVENKIMFFCIRLLTFFFCHTFCILY